MHLLQSASFLPRSVRTIGVRLLLSLPRHLHMVLGVAFASAVAFLSGCSSFDSCPEHYVQGSSICRY